MDPNLLKSIPTFSLFIPQDARIYLHELDHLHGVLLSDHWRDSNEIDNVMSEAQYMALDEEEERDDDPFSGALSSATMGHEGSTGDVSLDSVEEDEEGGLELELEWEPYKMHSPTVFHYMYAN